MAGCFSCRLGEAQLFCLAGGCYDADGDGFAVSVGAARRGAGLGRPLLPPFNSVGPGMAEVEHAAFATFERVAADDVLLNPRSCGYEGREFFEARGGIGRRNTRRGIAAQHLHGAGIAAVAVFNYEGFEHLGGAGKELPFGQRTEHVGELPGELRLPEGAEHVFVVVQIYAGFATQAGINHAQQRGGHIGVGDTPFVDGRGEAY